jgi:L-rhamnose isomerase
MGILQKKTQATTKVISVRVPADLYTDLEEVKQAADKAGLTLPVNELFTESLSRLVKQAKGELAALKSPDSTASTAA